MAAAKAIVKSVESCGQFINPDLTIAVDLKLNVCYVAENGVDRESIVQIIVQFKDNIAQIQAAMKAAIVADGATFGMTFANGDILLINFNKV